MAPMVLPPRSLIRQLLRYDAETGDLIWLPRPREMFADNAQFLTWNRRWPGHVAGYVRPNRRGSSSLHIGIKSSTFKEIGIFKAHRLVWLHVRGGPVPDIIDHKDHNHLNNRIENLRAATMPLNRANSKVRRDSKSGLKGISLTRNKTYKVNAGPGYSYRGTFRTIEEAIEAYKKAATSFYGEFSRWDQRQE